MQIYETPLFSYNVTDNVHIIQIFSIVLRQRHRFHSFLHSSFIAVVFDNILFLLAHLWSLAEMFSIAGKTINDKCTGVCEAVDRTNLLNAAGKNQKNIVCRRCASLIFPPNVVVIVKGLIQFIFWTLY